MTQDISEQAKTVIRRNTEEVQGCGDWALFDTLFSDNFHDHTPQPGMARDKASVLGLYQRFRHRPGVSAMLTTIAFDDSSLRWLGIST